MKKRTIRSLLETIIGMLDTFAIDVNVLASAKQDAAAYKQLYEEAKKRPADPAVTRAFEDKIRQLEQRLTVAERRVTDTEKDRDGWKAECERYQRGENPPIDDGRGGMYPKH